MCSPLLEGLNILQYTILAQWPISPYSPFRAEESFDLASPTTLMKAPLPPSNKSVMFKKFI